MTHVTRDGAPKLVRECDFPITSTISRHDNNRFGSI